MTQQTDTTGTIVLGRKLNNPYTVENMTKAFEHLRQKQGDAPTVNVRTTHLYVRFLPETREAYELLKSDKDLKLYETPLDYEVVLHGWRFHDPAVPADRPTWQYTAVPAGYAFPPNIHYEVLAELYLPESDPELVTAAPGEADQPNTADAFVNELVDEAMRMTGNFGDVRPALEASGARGYRFNPSGTIRVYDTRVNRLIPLEGVKVRARRWFDINEVVTDSNGRYFIQERFSRPVNYAIFYERADFDIRSGTFGQAWLDGPKQSGPWDVDLWDGAQRFYATIHRAAVDYYYGFRFNLVSPPQNNFWRPALKISAYDRDGDDSNGQTHPWSRTLGAFSTIDVYNPGRATDLIYGTVIHEIAHYSHWGLDREAFRKSEDKVAESWARGVQWVMTNHEYASLGVTGYNHYDGWQYLDAANPSHVAHMRAGYTPLVIDLIDTVNQRAVNGGNTGFADDRVTGFSIGEVEGALRGAKTLADWNANLKRLNRVPPRDLDDLFDFYSRL